MSYKVVRFFAREGTFRRVIKGGLTLEEAQEHCRDPETSSRTCKKYAGHERTRKYGPWFDGYIEE